MGNVVCGAVQMQSCKIRAVRDACSMTATVRSEFSMDGVVTAMVTAVRAGGKGGGVN